MLLILPAVYHPCILLSTLQPWVRTFTFLGKLCVKPDGLQEEHQS